MSGIYQSKIFYFDHKLREIKVTDQLNNHYSPPPPQTHLCIWYHWWTSESVQRLDWTLRSTEQIQLDICAASLKFPHHCHLFLQCLTSIRTPSTARPSDLSTAIDILEYLSELKCTMWICEETKDKSRLLGANKHKNAFNCKFTSI